ncbi:ankyrin repeat domain-containing protein [Caballeronia sp. GAWG1-5s-s]|uniref:ankyrin repeat domain-containing protein n=1 Tax=Caballeronia sp. GAWG1-5s-s TaxID=2921743 RepID=UPI002027C0C2|nr:ankyrin repeat domain-containing protein [Caballeronia sp. GAWG1-5s-s]
MKKALRLASVALWCASAPVFAYDYGNDFSKAVAAHYPPLVRLLITKGSSQNVQDDQGDTPLMHAIRSHDGEMSDLLMRYQPNLSLLNRDGHSAAIEAVIADDADILPSVLVRDDALQMGQAVALAKQARKRRVWNRFIELLGVQHVEEMADNFTARPGSFVQLGSRVAYAFSPLEDRRDVCARPASRLLLQGKVCEVTRGTVRVEWNLLSNLDNEDVGCSPLKRLHFDRKPEPQSTEWNGTFLGSCGVAPAYFSNVPATFPASRFIVPELK